jgi:hypothetical protein
MKNHKKDEKLFRTATLPPDDVQPVSPEAVGDAESNTSCVYNHRHHAVGSIIKNHDGPESVCSQDGEWKNAGEPGNKIQ